MQSKPLISVLCVDDHKLVRAGLVRILSVHPDMRVVADVSTGEEALEQFHAERPDVTLLDLQLPGLSGMETLRRIRKIDPAARVVVVTMREGDRDVYSAIQAGAAGYLIKDSAPEELVQVIRRVHAGEQAMSSDVSARFEAYTRQPTLTPREIQVLEMIAAGRRNKEIAYVLGIAEETTRVYVKSIFTKLNVHDRTAALAEAARRGFVHL